MAGATSPKSSDEVVFIGGYAPGEAPPRLGRSVIPHWNLVRGAVFQENTPAGVQEGPTSPEYYRYRDWATQSTPARSPVSEPMDGDGLEVESFLGGHRDRSPSQLTDAASYGSQWLEDRSRGRGGLAATLPLAP